MANSEITQNTNTLEIAIRKDFIFATAYNDGLKVYNLTPIFG